MPPKKCIVCANPRFFTTYSSKNCHKGLQMIQRTFDSSFEILHLGLKMWQPSLFLHRATMKDQKEFQVCQELDNGLVVSFSQEKKTKNKKRIVRKYHQTEMSE